VEAKWNGKRKKSYVGELIKASNRHAGLRAETKKKAIPLVMSVTAIMNEWMDGSWITT